MIDLPDAREVIRERPQDRVETERDLSTHSADLEEEHESTRI
jgi:hypothetical protein